VIANVNIWDVARCVTLLLIATNMGALWMVLRASRRGDLHLPWRADRHLLGVLILLFSNFSWVLDRLGRPPLWYGLPLTVLGNVALLLGLIGLIQRPEEP
jgi:hypothetical protein